MQLCIAGKNKIACDVIEWLVLEDKVPTEQISICPSKHSSVEHPLFPSLTQKARDLKIEQKSLDQLFDMPDLIFLSLEFDQIIDPEQFCSELLFNLHFSMLPDYRGCMTSFWPIYNGEQETGVTLHLIDKGIDTGPILAQRQIMIRPTETAESLYGNYCKYGFELLKDSVDTLFTFRKCGFAGLKPAAKDEGSYYPRSSFRLIPLELDFNVRAQVLFDKARALHFPVFQTATVRGKSVSHVEVLSSTSSLAPGNLLSAGETFEVFSTITQDVRIHYAEKSW